MNGHLTQDARPSSAPSSAPVAPPGSPTPPRRGEPGTPSPVPGRVGSSAAGNGVQAPAGGVAAREGKPETPRPSAGIQVLAAESPWRMSWRADPKTRALADRHYNRQKIGAAQFVPPGACLVLKTVDGSAAWITSWPKSEYVQHAWGGGLGELTVP